MIKISDKIRIVRVDALNLAVETYEAIKKRNGETEYEWKWFGYYGNLRSAINGILTHLTTAIADDDLVELKAIRARLEEIKSEVLDYVSEVANG